MIDMTDTSVMMDTLNKDAIEADRDLHSLFDAVNSLLESTDKCKYSVGCKLLFNSNNL